MNENPKRTAITRARAPLVPADVDLRDFPFMPLDVIRLRDSDLAALASAEEFRCAVLLWCASWHQVPAASLPDDDVVLASLAGLGRDIRQWRKLKAAALRGFIKCDDGRLYHPVVAEKAREAGRRRKTAKIAAKIAASARWGRSQDDPASGPIEASADASRMRTAMRDACEPQCVTHANRNATAMRITMRDACEPQCESQCKGQGEGEGQGERLGSESKPKPLLKKQQQARSLGAARARARKGAPPAAAAGAAAGAAAADAVLGKQSQEPRNDATFLTDAKNGSAGITPWTDEKDEQATNVAAKKGIQQTAGEPIPPEAAETIFVGNDSHNPVDVGNDSHKPAHDYDRIERLCREAAGLVDDPAPALFDLSPIVGLIDRGLDLDRDIVPGIRAVARAGRKGRSWAYYVRPILDAKDHHAKAFAAAGNGSAAIAEETAEEREARLNRMWRAWKRGTWPASWGPDPESAGCEIPRALIEKWSQKS